MMVSNRNLLFQGAMFRFHVKLQGCIQKNMVKQEVDVEFLRDLTQHLRLELFFSNKNKQNKQICTQVSLISPIQSRYGIFTYNEWLISLWYIYVGKIPTLEPFPWVVSESGRPMGSNGSRGVFQSPGGYCIYTPED